jgi:hypothetical protein
VLSNFDISVHVITAENPLVYIQDFFHVVNEEWTSRHAFQIKHIGDSNSAPLNICKLGEDGSQAVKLLPGETLAFEARGVFSLGAYRDTLPPPGGSYPGGSVLRVLRTLVEE